MVTPKDFQDFADFALPLINNGLAISMRELLDRWEAQREHEEVMDDIRQGFDDIEAGRGVLPDEAMADIRQTIQASDAVSGNVSHWVKEAKGSVIMEPGETVDDIRDDYYAKKYGIEK